MPIDKGSAVQVPAARKRRVAAAVAAAGADALLIAHLPDVRYLTGFTGSSAAVLLKGTRTFFFTDGRYTTQARAEVDAFRITIVDKSPAIAACAFALEQGIATCAFDTRTTSIETLEVLRKSLPAAQRRSFLVPAAGLVARQREIKDELEQDQMRAAAALGCQLFEDVLEYIVPGATEMEIAMALEYMARLHGAERMSFESIVAAGERAALPHARATRAKLPRRGFVLLDFGVLLNGYCSDMTRTVHLGRASKEEHAVYEAVLEAQEAGVAAVRAGVTGAEVDAAARDVLTRLGYGDSFSHSTGHGVGLEIHEAPRLAKLTGNATSEPLRAGMIVTIEPGAYLPGQFGVRIEDTVLVTRTGCEVLTPSPKAWLQL